MKDCAISGEHEHESERVIIATVSELEEAFEAWITDYRDDPDGYVALDESEPATYGEACAAHLVKLLDA